MVTVSTGCIIAVLIGVFILGAAGACLYGWLRYRYLYGLQMDARRQELLASQKTQKKRGVIERVTDRLNASTITAWHILINRPILFIKASLRGFVSGLRR